MWRSFDVGAVIESLTDEVEVVAGRQGMDREVYRAQLIEDPAAFERVGSGELLVTRVDTLQASGQSWTALLGHLATAGIAGIAMWRDPAAPPPDELLEAADPLGLPILAFHHSSGLAEVTNAVVDGLLVAQSRQLERFLDIHQRFTPIVVSGGGASEIATTLHALLGCEIVVVDSEGRRVVAAPADVADRFEDRPTTVEPVLAGEHRYGQIIALAEADELDDDGRLALQRAAVALAVRMAHASAVAAEQERFASVSLEALIAGQGGDITDVIERAASFGWDLHRPRAVLLASIDPPARTESLRSTLAAVAAAARATLGQDAIVWERTATIAALVAPETVGSSERREMADRLRRELDQAIRTETISIGVGRRVDDPRDLPHSYGQAARAVEVGRWVQGRHVTEVFDELGLERLLATTPATDLAEFVDQSIGPLISYDRDHGADLVDSLAMWLQTRNMAEAARQMYVHYNTFKNRLDRIEMVLGPVIGDAARSLECEVAIHIFRHYDGPWNPV
jgi:PucR family transcriptional regulator, purine catabolism regulatory protein